MEFSCLSDPSHELICFTTKENIEKIEESIEKSIYDRIAGVTVEHEGGTKNGLWRRIRSRFAKRGPLKPFGESFMFHLVDHLSQASKIGFAVAMVDSVAHMMKLMGFTFQGWIDNVSSLFSKIIYSGWITLRLTLLKRYARI